MADIRDKERKQWYPVYTHSRSEKKAYQELLNKDIEAYLPLRRQMKQWSDRKKWVEEPLIKSYVFVHIHQHQQTEVLMTSGVARFLYFSGKIASMPDRQIEELKLVLASAYEFEITEDELLPGEKIIIKAGSLKGMHGEIIKYHSQKQLLLRLGDIKYNIIVHVPASLIERLQ
ncbi:antitermination factor NusG [Pedobacter cryoconitis]|uniref:Antitermination factor NusG n=1 Tax=Pedobacter cryoconitis TaxID=188932 RepID=A0A127VJ13_9SPHI|nr:UpxY family transcription antiterminator [Pedobacter cryoconitis]AMQ01258.1 antitermination factor NusG [Pedobacter cryoconitis]